jgi:hypothetical protein
MRVFAVLLALVSVVAAVETITNIPCSATNETLACESLREDIIGPVCCAQVTVRNGSSLLHTANICYSRTLAHFMPSNTVGTYTTSFSCLTAAPTNFASTLTPNCTNETSCAADYCCMSRNVTQNNSTRVLTNGNKCVDNTYGLA